jgi:hypothetical protein
MDKSTELSYNQLLLCELHIVSVAAELNMYKEHDKNLN